MPEQAAQQLQRLSWPRAVSFVAAFAGCALNIWSAVDGWLVVAEREEVPPPCAPLRYWLLFYCVIVTALPCCLVFAIVLVPAAIFGTLAGQVARSYVPATCEHSVPENWAFVDDAALRGLASAACMLVMFVIFQYGNVEREVLGPVVARGSARTIPTGDASSVLPQCLSA